MSSKLAPVNKVEARVSLSRRAGAAMAIEDEIAHQTKLFDDPNKPAVPSLVGRQQEEE